MQFLGIILMCILAAVAYGIAQDQIAARVCVEYFTIGHPPIFDTDDPTFLGLGWDIIATWWVGLLLGVPLAIVARVGSRPKRSLNSLIGSLLHSFSTVPFRKFRDFKGLQKHARGVALCFPLTAAPQ